MASLRSQRAFYVPVSFIIGCLIPWSLFVEHAHAVVYSAPPCIQTPNTFRGQNPLRREAGKSEMSKAEMDAAEARLKEKLKAKSLAAQGGFSEGMRSAETRQTVTVISVRVHVLSGNDGKLGYVPRIQIVRQIEQLKHDFAGDNSGLATDTLFTFNLGSITRHYNTRWHELVAGSAAERAAKTTTRVGGANILNLWIADPKTEDMSGLLGYATFPSDYDLDPAMDGVVINYTTLPGGTSDRYNLGRTATHEVGHWLGLYHTFGTDPINPCMGEGDQVDDTVTQQMHYTCTAGYDSCPKNKGKDMIHNFMGYADDCCMLEFTQGQAERMRTQWQAFRVGATE